MTASGGHVPADEGHTFRVAVRMRGSSKVVGDLHYRDSEDFTDLEVVEVRAWDLPSALITSAALPFSVWFSEDTTHASPATRGDAGLAVDPAVVEATGDALFEAAARSIRDLRAFMRENPTYKSPATRGELGAEEAS